MELIMRKRLKLNLAQLLRLRTAFHTSLLFYQYTSKIYVRSHGKIT